MPLARASGRLWLGLHFPALAVEVFTRGMVEPPACVVRTGEGSTQRVCAVNAAAAALGISPGLRLGAAHALGSIEVFARRPDLEHEALTALAAWAGQFTSEVSLAAPDALLLEIGGSLRLFDGITGLREVLHREAAGLGYSLQMAGAPTPLAALWLARAARRRVVQRAARLPAALASLPLTVLDLPARTLRSLAGLGVADIGELARLPRRELAQRLGPALVDLLDRALGRRPDPRALFQAPAGFQRRLELPTPLPGGEHLDFVLERLLRELTACLRAREGGVQRFHLLFEHEHAGPTRLEVGLLAPGREHARLWRVLLERRERLRLPGPVSAVTLAAAEILPLAGVAGDLFDDAAEGLQARDLDLIERLRARLGNEAVTGLATVAEHRPEYAVRECSPAATGGERGAGGRPAQESRARRPLWLLPEPMPLAEEGGRPLLRGRLRLGNSRERLQSGWWDGADQQRDYFIAEDSSGVRLWVYRDLRAGRWYLHGIFD